MRKGCCYRQITQRLDGYRGAAKRKDVKRYREFFLWFQKHTANDTIKSEAASGQRRHISIIDHQNKLDLVNV